MTGAAPPPNRGAHTLAWWLAHHHARFLRLAHRAGVTRDQVRRFLAGEILPSDEAACAIAEATAGAVLPMDWERPARASWTERPNNAAWSKRA